jgi:hypothetical protein
MNSGLVHSELNFNFRLFAKTISSSAAWGFDRLRLFNPLWHTKIQIRRLDGSVVDTQDFSSPLNFEHNFSFDLSENVNNDEYSVYIAGVPASAVVNQAYAWPTGYSATTGKNAELTYWDFREANVLFSGTTGRIRFENNPITAIGGASLLNAGEINFANCQLDAETLADMLIGLDTTGGTGGSFNYSGNLAAPAERGLVAYNSLKDTKAWTLTGAIPAAAAAYDADYQAVLDYATANAIALPDQAQIDIDNQLILDLKNQGRWAKIDMFFNLKGTSTPAFKLICWKRLTQGTGFGSLTWNLTGVKGNETNAYIDPNFILSTDSVNYTLFNASVVLNISKDPASATGTLFGTATGTSMLSYLRTGGYGYPRVNDNTSSITDEIVQGLFSLSRILSTEFVIKNKPTPVTITRNVTGLSSVKLSILAFSNEGNSFFSSDEISCFMLGSALGSTEHDELKTILE